MYSSKKKINTCVSVFVRVSKETEPIGNTKIYRRRFIMTNWLMQAQRLRSSTTICLQAGGLGKPVAQQQSKSRGPRTKSPCPRGGEDKCLSSRKSNFTLPLPFSSIHALKQLSNAPSLCQGRSAFLLIRMLVYSRNTPCRHTQKQCFTLNITKKQTTKIQKGAVLSIHQDYQLVFHLYFLASCM